MNRTSIVYFSELKLFSSTSNTLNYKLITTTTDFFFLSAKLLSTKSQLFYSCLFEATLFFLWENLTRYGLTCAQQGREDCYPRWHPPLFSHDVGRMFRERMVVRQVVDLKIPITGASSPKLHMCTLGRDLNQENISFWFIVIQGKYNCVWIPGNGSRTY